MPDPRLRRAAIATMSAVVTAALAFPAASAATVTIGSNLGRAPTATQGCGGGCTVSQASLGVGSQAQSGLTSPVNGTVVRWRIRVGAVDTEATSFRVIRSLGGNLFTGAGTSATVTPPLGATTPYETQLPIRIGDSIGVNCCTPGNLEAFVPDPGAVGNKWFATTLADSAAGRSPSATSAYEVAINADIEPTSTFSVMGVQRSKHGKLLISANLPNPGILVAGDEKDATVAVAAAKKRKKKPQLLKRASVQLSAPGSTQLLVFPTKMAKTALAQGKKVKAGLKLSFTPTAGTASTQVIKVKLRR